MVLKAGFEPARVTPHAPQTCVSTRFHHFGILDDTTKKPLISMLAFSQRAEWSQDDFSGQNPGYNFSLHSGQILWLKSASVRSRRYASICRHDP